MYDLKNKTALVTGAAQGIGFGIASALALAGSRVIIADRDLSKAQAAAGRIEAAAGEAMALPLDVTDERAVSDCVQQAIQQYSRIDILVNNAGVHSERIGQRSTVRQFNQCWDVNLLGVWRVTDAILPHFKANGSGKIINIASINGRKPMIGAPAYSASKAAVISLTQSLAMELGAHNINVNAICPGGVMTAMADLFKDDLPDLQQTMIGSRILKRELLPEDIGHAVVFFASDYARNITGQALNVDGGCLMS